MYVRMVRFKKIAKNMQLEIFGAVRRREVVPELLLGPVTKNKCQFIRFLKRK